jgi:hypothetical protein
MESFILSENTDQYKELVWRQFYHSEKNRFFGERNRFKIILFTTLPILFFLAYSANGKVNNLLVACFLLLGPCLMVLVHFVKKSDLKKEVANFSSSSPYTITVNENGITYETVKSQTELKWDYFFDYEEFEGNFTLYRNKLRKEVVYLPLSLAPDNEALINLVRNKVKAREY